MKTHYLPRTGAGWTATFAFLGLMSLAQPPVVFWVNARLGATWVLGLPFLYVYLGVLYFAMIGVLVWAMRRNV